MTDGVFFPFSALILVPTIAEAAETEVKSLYITYDVINFHASQQFSADNIPADFRGSNGPNAIMLQIEPGSQTSVTDDSSPVELFMVMSVRSGTSSEEKVTVAFDALSACANLASASDQDSDKESEDAGWIFGNPSDADIEEASGDGQEMLGPGAGTRRQRDADGYSGDTLEKDNEGDLAKWQRQ